MLAATILAPPVVRRFAVPRQERVLEQQFGDAYRDYLRRVPRWP